MFVYILLAIVNGIVIGMSRAINSRLGVDVGAFKASFWNHIVGFIFLTGVIVLVGGWSTGMTTDIPAFTYVAGFFGALFVAVNSYVFPRIGALKTTLLVISGQMISSVLLDYHGGAMGGTLMQLCGVVMILFGVYLAKSAASRRSKA